MGICNMGICNIRTTTTGFRIRRFPQNTGNDRALCQKKRSPGRIAKRSAIDKAGTR